MKIKATLQMRKDTPVKTQIKRDKFKIDGNILIIRSWIDRNKMYETQVYEYIKP